MDDPIRVLIVDDHPVVRTGLKGMLSSRDNLVVVGEAENGEVAVRLCAERQPNVVLMDLRMPQLSGVQATIEIRQQQPAVQVLVLTTYDEDRDIMGAINAGAIGYLLKDAPREDLYRAIEAAARGESVLDTAVATRLMEHMRNPPPENELSQREVEVLEWVAQGKANKEIGKELHISESTVKTHLIHIFEKLDVSDRTAAVRVAIERGILQIG